MTAMTSQQAATIAREAHAGQTDKTGHDYFDVHVEPVAMLVSEVGGTDALVAVAYLHDVVEDTTMSFDDLTDLGINSGQRSILQAVTRLDGDTYDSYLESLAVTGGPWAIALKACDMISNGNHARMQHLDDATANRLRDKYAKGVETLNDLLDVWYRGSGGPEKMARSALRIAREVIAP